MSREDVEFSGPGGATLRGWFYAAAGPEPRPCVVLQHGFSAVKEMYLDDYAEAFRAAGVSCLVYDHPGFGASDAVPGTPRQEIDPWQQVRGVQDAITHASLREDVDEHRIGVWGSSYGAGNAYVTAAIDHRVTVVAGQVPFISGPATFEALVGPDAQVLDLCARDRRARVHGADPLTVPAVAETAVGQAMPGEGAYRWFTTAHTERAPSWLNEVTARSLEIMRGWEPAVYFPRITVPLLMVVAPEDELTASDVALTAFEQARSPKRLVRLPGGHFDAYTGEQFTQSSAAAADWFAEHLVNAPIPV